jgi:hypothetical protein
MLDAYPMLNLLIEQSLGVALVSYSGRLSWGFMADWQLIPDLHAFVLAVEDAFRELCEVAGLGRPARVDAGAETARPRAVPEAAEAPPARA